MYSLTDVRANFNQNNYTGAVFFDVSKAFDRTWHDGIIYKLNTLKVPQYILFRINNFLQDRSFYVCHNKKKSSAYVIVAGVPQGSTISPTLFSIFISDIDSPELNLLVNVALYADDLCIWYTSKKLKNIESAYKSKKKNKIKSSFYLFIKITALLIEYIIVHFFIKLA
jgi:hypothetical protein